MTRTTSQSAMILNFLESGGSLTPIEALQKFSCFRLAARINDLREAGHEIQTEILKDDNGNLNSSFKKAFGRNNITRLSNHISFLEVNAIEEI